MTTLNQALVRYERVLKGRIAASSVKTYRSRLRFAAEHLTGHTLGRITLADLEDLLATYREERSANTTALMATVLKQFFAWCVEVELLTKDPALKLRAPKRTKWQPRAVSAEQIDLLLAAITADCTTADWRLVRNESIVRIMLYAGLRRAEVADLRWPDVDLPGRAVRVVGKGGRARTLPLHHSLCQHLTRLQDATGRDYGAVFARQDGTPLHCYTINMIFQRWIVGELGFAITPHRLRHSFATRLIERGAALDEVRDLLGHESIATTQVYIATSPERLRAAVERL